MTVMHHLFVSPCITIHHVPRQVSPFALVLLPPPLAPSDGPQSLILPPSYFLPSPVSVSVLVSVSGLVSLFLRISAGLQDSDLETRQTLKLSGSRAPVPAPLAVPELAYKHFNGSAGLGLCFAGVRACPNSGHGRPKSCFQKPTKIIFP
jgi:hypothetical protein